MTEEMSICGGFIPEESVTPEEEKICREMKPDIEEKAGANFAVYTPLTFRTQVVNGINHLVKVYVGVDKCVHAMIYEALPCYGGKLTVTRVQHPKTASDPLIPFDH